MSESMYRNIYDYRDRRYPFQIFTGGRGIGKTYSALKGSLFGECEGKFIFTRRTGTEMELLSDTKKGDEGANPFKKINANEGCNVGLLPIIKNLYGVYNREEDKESGKLSHIGAPIGYGTALSTISSIRGVDFSDCTDWIYDEFIKEAHVKAMKSECDAFLNAYETMNRNREMEGLPPLYAWLLSNSNDIYNPIFVGLGLVNTIEKMVTKGQTDLYIRERGLAIHLLPATDEFMEKKAKTAIAKLTKGSAFYDMAFSNKFAYNDFSLIGYRNLTGYRPICSIGTATFYMKKGEREIYVSYAKAKCPTYKAENQQDVMAFKQRFGIMFEPYFVNGSITFESYELKAIVLDYIL